MESGERASMVRIIFLLILSVVSSCALSNPSFPEEFLVETDEITLDDLNVMIETGFDFKSSTPDGKVYLEWILSHPQPTTQKILKILIERKIVSPRSIFQDGKTLLNYVVSNPGDISLQMAKDLLVGNRAFFLSLTHSPLLDAIHNPGKISWKLIDFLIQQGFSVNVQNPTTGVTPALEFFRSYRENIPELEDYMMSHVNTNIKDHQNRNFWHYLLSNQTEHFYSLFEKVLKNTPVRSLMLIPDKEKIYPLFLLVSNPRPESYLVYQKLKQDYEKLFQKETWVDELFLWALYNNGPALKDLFADIVTNHPDVNALNRLGQNSLLVAVQNTGEELLPILEYLIRARVNIYQLDKNKNGVLNYAVLNKGYYAADILSFLERQGVSLAVADEFGRTLINYAVLNEGKGAKKVLDLLLGRRFPVLTPDKSGETPLQALFKNPSEQALFMLRGLIYASYQGKSTEPYSENIIFSAAQSTSVYAYKMMLTLIQQGFSVNPQNLTRQNALFYTVQNSGPSALKMTRLLLMKGLSPDSVDRDGNSLLMYALDNPVHRFSMVHLLLRWGTDPYRHNVMGISVVDRILKMNARDRWRYQQIFEYYGLRLDRNGRSV